MFTHKRKLLTSNYDQASNKNLEVTHDLNLIRKIASTFLMANNVNVGNSEILFSSQKIGSKKGFKP